MKSIPFLLLVVCMATAVQQGVGRDDDHVVDSKGGVQEQFWGIWGRPGYWGWARPLPVIARPPNALKCHAAVDGVYACLRKVMTPFWITRRDYTLHDCCSTLDHFKTQCKSLYVYTKESYIFPHSLLDQCSSAPPQPPQPSHHRIPFPKPPHVRPAPPSPAPSPSSDDSDDLVPTPSPAPSDDSSDVPTPSPAPSPSSDDDSVDVPTPSPAPSPSSDDDDSDDDNIPTPSPAPSPSSGDDSDEAPAPSPAPLPSSDDSDEVPTPAPSPDQEN